MFANDNPETSHFVKLLYVYKSVATKFWTVLLS